MAWLSYEDARKALADDLTPWPLEDFPLEEALGRISGETVRSENCLPLFDNSAMDGYAVRVEDFKGMAQGAGMVSLSVVGEVPAGKVFEGEVKPGQCVRVFTGSPIPQGTDAVVMQEDTRRVEEGGGRIEVLEAPRPFENIRFIGEDLPKGTVLWNQGERLSIGHLGLAAALGVRRVKLGWRPRVGLVATGSELLDSSEEWSPGKIFESNRLILAAWLKKEGYECRIYPLIQDSLKSTQDALGQALEVCDVVISSGGVSVGDYDFVKPAFESLGGVIQFWRLSIKPGKPFFYGRRGDRYFFGLPGNPMSAWVTFLTMVRPALLLLQGATNPELPIVPGRLSEAIRNRGDRLHFMRVYQASSGEVSLMGEQASHRMGGFGQANGLVAVPAEAFWESGRAVEVMRWD